MDSRGEASEKQVLLTGATGFVGRQIHRALLEQGHRVAVVIRTGSADRLIGRAHVRETDDVFAQSKAWWAEACEGIDTLVHAAWYVDPQRYLGATENLACVGGSLALALGALEAGIKHLVGLGTCFEYRLPSYRLTVDASLAPTTLYAASKVALFEMLQALFASTGTGFSWARLFYLHGAGEHPARFMPYLRGCLARNEVANLSVGTQVRDFLDVGTAGDMIARIVTTGQLHAINICSGEAVTIRQLAERTADEIGRRDLLRFGAVPLKPTDPAAVVGVCNIE